MRDATRDAVMVEVTSRLLEACLQQAESTSGMALDVLVNDTLYHEKKRLETHPDSLQWSSDIEFWDSVKGRLGRAGDEETRALLARIIDRFVKEVVGHFEPWVYGVSTRVVPKALPLMFNAVSPMRLLSNGIPELQDSVRIRGELELLQRCQRMGTVILAPTHVSNIDSVVLGWALYALGLPPFTYGAGLNLFTNPLLSFFMRNLGAYRVDRRKSAPLYKDALKEYATVIMEKGQHQLFFPGGTRSRSGRVESRLKLGLLGCGLRAYINNLRYRRDRPKVFVVPCNLNFHLVLEAETLIEDHLKLVGRSNYIITDDESSRPKQVARFLHNALALDNCITMHVGRPLDPFGNRVDEDGESMDMQGRRVDITRYVIDQDGEPGHYPQRDRVYVEQTGAAVAEAFRVGNTVMPTNLVAFAVFEVLRGRFPSLDLYRLLRTAGGGTGSPMEEVAEAVRRMARRVAEMEEQDKIRAHEIVRSGDPGAILADALRHFGSYHSHAAVVRRGDRLFVEDMNLLYYYRNRLDGYGLEDVLDRSQGGAP